MATLPQAIVTIDDEAGALAGGTDLVTVMACVELNADVTPRVFSSTTALLDQHGYTPGVDYCALHFEETGKPVIFIGLPKVTAGTIGRLNATGNTGSSAVTVAAGSNGVLENVDGTFTVVTGGTVGTSQIVGDLSLDGGRTTKRIRIGTASSYAIPYVGQTLNLGAGTLVAGDIALRWSTTAPRWDQAGILAARTALAAQTKQMRSWLVEGELLVAQDATDVLAQVNAYETSNERFVFARTQVRDRRTQAAMSRVQVSMTGAATITFAEVGPTGDTITRSVGSFVTEGFAVGMAITVAGSTLNNFTHAKITAVSALVLTLDTQDLTAEGPASGVTITGSHGLTFAEVGATADTITRSGGSWLADGFAVGDTVTITGTASNNVSGAIAALTATVLTFNTTDLAAELIGSYSVTITAGETDSQWVAAMDTAFASIDDKLRIDIAAGRAFKRSAITGWLFRRPAMWAASLREYQHDVQIPCWRKEDGPLDGWSVEDDEGTTVEHDERVSGGLLLPRFTCLRTYSNGPAGVFVALSLTRALEGSLLSRTHNVAVTNVACSVVHAETENAIGMVLELDSVGHATPASLRVLEDRVNSALAINLLQRKSEGPRASSAAWKASTSDILNVPGAELTGVLDLRLGATLEKIRTRVRVQTAGS
jgi:hypothetical protein